MFPFEKILTNIANERCLLIIGPEIMHFEGKPMNMFLRDKLCKQYKDYVTYYYENDGFFLFPSDDESVKSDVAQSLRQECVQLPFTDDFDEGILKNIAQIPFHLVISINPDTFLSDTFFKYDVTHRFSHFRKGESPSDEVATPTREEPLIYNIAGSVLEDESLVLDYEDLFALISSSLGASSLPVGLQTALKKIRSYIFIGFPFEKWYTQVMLRIVCGKEAYPKYAGPHKISKETHVFLANEFKIEFWDPEIGDFLTAFIQAAASYKDTSLQNNPRPFLRELLEVPHTPQEILIRRELQNGQYAKAIASLTAFAKARGKHEDEAAQISGRYQYLTQNQQKIDSRDFMTTLNQIADAILNLARQIASST